LGKYGTAVIAVMGTVVWEVMRTFYVELWGCCLRRYGDAVSGGMGIDDWGFMGTAV
jgi:hypothetical protein